MGNQLHVQKGARPWLPADDVTLIEELDRYDVPLAGLIEQSDVTYLFTCLDGEVERANLWAYAPMTDREVEQLLASEPENFAEVIEHCLANRSVLVALAIDWKIADWRMIDVGLEGSAATENRFLSVIRKDWDEQRDQAEKLARHRELANS